MLDLYSGELMITEDLLSVNIVNYILHILYEYDAFGLSAIKFTTWSNLDDPGVGTGTSFFPFAIILFIGHILGRSK